MKHLPIRAAGLADARDGAPDALGGLQDFTWQSSMTAFGDPGSASAATGGDGFVGYQIPYTGSDAGAPADGDVAAAAVSFAPATSAPALADLASLANPAVGSFEAPITDFSIGANGATAAQVQQALDESGLSVNGAGITVGVLSDSFNDLGGAAADEADGALPPAADIDVIKDLASGGTDEGRAMMQIIHDIAPGADFAFCTAVDGEQDFANGILALAAAGCKVIVDDVSYPDEPFFQNGVVAQAIQTVEAEGVTYVTAAGNDASNAYQAAWTPISGTYDGTMLTDAESFSGSLVQTITVEDVTRTDTVPLLLEWNQAYGQATSDLEILVFNSSGKLVGTATNPSSGEPTNPWVEFDFTKSGTYYVAIENLSGPNPGLIKEISEGDGLPVTIGGANAGTVYGHAMTPGAITAGAVDVSDTPAFGVSLPTSESFSSSGAGTELLFANNGTALSSPDALSPVALSGVDNIDTTVPGGLSDFYGTSAASASLAGVAALILSANPTLTPAEVELIMEETALPMANTAVSGAGLVQVDPAVADAEAGAVVVSALNFSVSENQSFAISSDFTVSNPDGDNIAQYVFEDFGGGSGHFSVGGTAQPDGQVIDVPANDLSTVQYVGGSSPGSDTLEVGVYDDTTNSDAWSAPFTATTTIAPTVSALSFSVSENQSFAISSDFTVSNPDGDNITQYVFEDFGGGSGHFSVGGTAKPDGQVIDVPANDLSTVQYVGGSSPGSDTLEVGVYDDTTNSDAWSSPFTAATTIALTLTVSALSFSVSENQSFAISSDFTVSNPDGDNIAQYVFEDFGGGSGHFSVGGTAQPDGQVIDVPANDLSTVQYVGGSSPGSDTLEVGVYDDTTNSDAWSALFTATTTIAPTSAPVPDDFNGDGVSDVLWRNSNSSPAEWFMDGSTISSTATPTYQGSAVSPDASWSVAGIGDFNGDGDADILWRNGNGSLVEWLMNGSTILSTATPTYQGSAVSPGSSWSVAGIGDFTGSGDADILWQQSTTGTLAMWLMNGSTIEFERVSHVSRQRNLTGRFLERCRDWRLHRQWQR